MKIFGFPVKTYIKPLMLLMIIKAWIFNDKSQIYIWSWHNGKMIAWQGRKKIVAIDK